MSSICLLVSNIVWRSRGRTDAKRVACGHACQHQSHTGLNLLAAGERGVSRYGPLCNLRRGFMSIKSSGKPAVTKTLCLVKTVPVGNFELWLLTISFTTPRITHIIAERAIGYVFSPTWTHSYRTLQPVVIVTYSGKSDEISGMHYESKVGEILYPQEIRRDIVDEENSGKT